MQLTKAQMDVLSNRARAVFAQEIVELWRIIAPKAFPDVRSLLNDDDLLSLAAMVLLTCENHEIFARPLIIRLCLEVIRATHLGLNSDYIDSMMQYFFESENSYLSALDWIDHVLDDPMRYTT